jgi:hypothetical protein
MIVTRGDKLPGTSRLPPTRILLVDDHQANLLALEAILQPLGHTLVKATSGEEALKRLLSEDFALILLDVQMPGLDGLQTASLIKSHARTASIPIIFITAASGTAERVFQGYARGAVDYIVKPFDPDVLTSKVNVFAELYQKTEKIKQQAKLLRDQQIAAIERRNEQRFRQLTDSLPLPVCATRVDGVPYYCNRAWSEYAGCRAEEPVGLTDPSVVHPDEAPRAQSTFERALRLGAPFEVDVRLLRASDQQYRWHIVRGVPERQERAGIVGWVVTATDVDDKRRAEEVQAAALEREKRAREAAEIANRSKDEFLATISHELRTPLNAILGWSQMLRKGGLDAAAQARAMETIERNAAAQARLISDLLDVSRIVTGKIRLDVRPIDLESVINAAVDSLRPAMEAKGIVFDMKLERLERPINADPNRLQQVVWNLLTNAVKFGSKHVVLTLCRTASAIEVSVTDDGQGIHPDFINQVFDRFQQADSSTTRAHGGLGLGLAIVRHIVQLHGGTVLARSDGPGRGATFTFRLPARASGTTAIRAPMANRLGVLDLAGVDVLVVDDEEDARDLMSTLLARTGAHVRTAGSVAEAMEEIERARPHLIISDIAMPHEDGYELIRRVRALHEQTGVRVPALAVTAYATNEDRTRILQAGFESHLTKPVEPTQIFSSIGRVLGRAFPNSEVACEP